MEIDMRITPTVGRQVWYRASTSDPIGDYGNFTPLAATVCYVHSDGRVNLQVLTADGRAQPRLDVVLVQEDDPTPAAGGYCEWMPYQKMVAERDAAAVKEPFVQA